MADGFLCGLNVGNAFGAGEEILGMLMLQPEQSHLLQNKIRYRDKAIFMSLATVDMHTVIGRIDIGELEIERFSQPQPHRIGAENKGSVAQLVGGLK